MGAGDRDRDGDGGEGGAEHWRYDNKSDLTDTSFIIICTITQAKTYNKNKCKCFFFLLFFAKK